MNKVKDQVQKYKEKLPLLFLVAAGVAAFNTLLRPDYNLVIYLYLYYIWTMMGNSKVKNYIIYIKYYRKIKVKKR